MGRKHCEDGHCDGVDENDTRSDVRSDENVFMIENYRDILTEPMRDARQSNLALVSQAWSFCRVNRRPPMTLHSCFRWD